MFVLRRKMIAEDGPGWAVTDFDGFPMRGRWETEEEAVEHGLAGVYLLSGCGVKEIEPEVDPQEAAYYDAAERRGDAQRDGDEY